MGSPLNRKLPKPLCRATGQLASVPHTEMNCISCLYVGYRCELIVCATDTEGQGRSRAILVFTEIDKKTDSLQRRRT